MALKYDKLDTELFSWLRRQRWGATTAQAITALKVTHSTSRRHISRRFSQLEDRGTLLCELKGTARVCTVIGDLPETLAKTPHKNTAPKPLNQDLLASNSEEFLAAGGVIEKLSSAWDDPEKNAPRGSAPLGESVYGLPAYCMDSFK